MTFFKFMRMATVALPVSLAASATLAQDAPAPKVSIAAAYTDELLDEAIFIGKGEAIDKVDLVARVSGFVEKIHVKDGDVVSAGDLLFEIEPEVYEATLVARQADLAQAEANLRLTEVELVRKTELFERDVGTEADRDVALADNEVAKAQVEMAKAAIEQAQLDVDYTKVHAPFDGRVGRASVSVGELVGTGSASLINIVRTAPIYAEFSLSEKQLVSVMEQHDATVDELANEGKAPDVHAILPNGDELDEIGRIVFADNRIDPTTGTITLRAQFDNARGLLLDGAFLNLRISSAEPSQVLMIPQAAVQRDQRGDFVLVVGEQQTVEQRYVTLGRQVEAAVVVEDGMREGEAVIVEGLQRVRPGVEVDAVLAGQPTEEQ
ncbi:efflux RND transporter periplasmic adaptor subunit [Shimia sp. MMG029]|uniref:efflux RND transporter periplasmic adaptor subunit n=1 Tax=Shimia sp. MMG029 TaxID=3021978 RepID=UPI0022FDC9D6|nr:efflux RND transporter periplasmic adaptor subunit [Shimia sp. MMG029]MDA5558453.1 efflux RND transporter periplasmic adaptor subunit [Shimia sp. MMG029]